MLLVMIEQLVFTKSVNVEEVCYSYIVIRIDRSVVAECQRPVIIGPNEWPPNTVLNSLEQGNTVWETDRSLDHIKFLVFEVLLLTWK
jgi:hypothetical protein